MTDLEYRLLMETAKNEILREMEKNKTVKAEFSVLEVKRKQQAIFDECFPGLRESDTGRYWRLKETVIKLTNLCRFRSDKFGAWDSAIRTEVESESAIVTYKTICETSAKLIGKLD